MSERTKSSIDIAAPPEAVLRVITDFEAYPQWTGEVKEARIEERDDAGRATRAWYRMDAGALRDEHTLAYEYPSDVEVALDPGVLEHDARAGRLLRASRRPTPAAT